MNQSKIILSICIPTYNRELELDRLLGSIEKSLSEVEIRDFIEVIVSDNASMDRTSEVVKSYSSKINNLIYSANDNNQGFAKNINKVVSLASGSYCWLVGSDDCILIDGLKTVLERIDGLRDVIVGDVISGGRVRSFYEKKRNGDSLILNEDNLIDLFNSCGEVSGLFAFISSIIVKKAFWDSAQLIEFELNHDYTHQIRIIKNMIAQESSLIHIIGRPIVSTGTASNEFNQNIVDHLELDLKTLKYLCENILKNVSAPPIIGGIIKRQYIKRRVFAARISSRYDRWESIADNFKFFGLYCDMLVKSRYDHGLLFLYKIYAKFKSKVSKFTLPICAK